MKPSIVNGVIQIDILSLIESLSDDDKKAIIESLSCWDAVVSHVTSQILDGSTENGYWKGHIVVPEPTKNHGIAWATREIARRCDQVAAKEIQRLEVELAGVLETNEDLRKIISGMRNHKEAW